jgi:hypothetical protein
MTRLPASLRPDRPIRPTHLGDGGPTSVDRILEDETGRLLAELAENPPTPLNPAKEKQ